MGDTIPSYVNICELRYPVLWYNADELPIS